MEKREVINEAINHLNKGEVILCPTDSIWGLSCDATNEDAVKKILALKKRDDKKGFTILLNSDAMVNNCMKDVPGVVWDLIDLSTEPLSIVIDHGMYVAKNAMHENGSISFRYINHGFCNDLLTKFRKPIVSTSANLSGEETPIVYQKINPEIRNNVAYSIPEKIATDMSGKPSKIIKIKENGEVIILRK